MSKYTYLTSRKLKGPTVQGLICKQTALRKFEVISQKPSKSIVIHLNLSYSNKPQAKRSDGASTSMEIDSITYVPKMIPM